MHKKQKAMFALVKQGCRGEAHITHLPVGSDGFPKENDGVQPSRQNRLLSSAQQCHPEGANTCRRQA